MKDFLPIGSVVLLQGAEKRIMLIGARQKKADTEKMWDYSAVLYPEGMVDSNNVLLFNMDQVEKIFFLGFQDSECLRFAEMISKFDETRE